MNANGEGMQMRRDRSPLAVVVLVLAALLTGCFQQDTDVEPSSGNVERNETVTAANLVIVTDGQGNGVLVGTLINNGETEDRLVGVDVESESGPVEVELADGPVALPQEEPVRLADPVRVTLRSEQLRQGWRAPVELTFESSAAISTTVTVESQTGPYADVEIPG